MIEKSLYELINAKSCLLLLSIFILYIILKYFTQNAAGMLYVKAVGVSTIGLYNDAIYKVTKKFRVML